MASEPAVLVLRTAYGTARPLDTSVGLMNTPERRAGPPSEGCNDWRAGCNGSGNRPPS